MSNKYIWVLTEAGETRELFAELNKHTIDHLAALFFDEMEDEDDPDAPKSVEDVKEMIQNNVINSEDHTCDFYVYQLRRQVLNTTIDGTVWHKDPEFDVKQGTEVWEAGQRIVMGCDMAYAIEPVGYFTKRIDNPGLRGLEWIAWKLS